MIRVSICLSDIPKDKIKKSDKNGKSYAEIIVDQRKEKDDYDNTHTVYMSQTKEEREAKVNKVYVGNGKEYVFSNNNTPQPANNNYNTPPDTVDDLPF